jgi:hypothetical protein
MQIRTGRQEERKAGEEKREIRRLFSANSFSLFSLPFLCISSVNLCGSVPLA